MLPLIVMKVMPAATQPTTEAVVISAVRLGIERKLGVSRAHVNNATKTTARAAEAGLGESGLKRRKRVQSLAPSFVALTMRLDRARSDA